MTTSSQTPGEQAEFDALVALAQGHHRAGRLAEAAAAYRQILALRPDLAEVCNNLGSVLLSQGQLDEAATQLQRAIDLKPTLFQAHNSLGDIFHTQGQLDLAAAQYRQAIALVPDLAETHSNLAAILGLQGDLDAAAAHCERALALKPNLFQAHNNLGKVLQKQGKFQQAAARFRLVVALRPDYAEAYHNLGDALKELGLLDEAVAQYERALALKPGLFQTCNNLGTVLRKQGKLDQAVARLEQAIALRPNVADTYNNLANVLKQQGKLERALACYDQALALKPDFADVHYARCDLKTFRTSDPDFAALEALADSGRLPPSDRVSIHFALGKALEDIGDYPRAFEHLLRGNALKRTEIDYDEAAGHQDFRRIAQVFDAPLLERLAAAGDPSTVPIFVLGMPRSGSTLVEQILASHPQVHAAGELSNLDRVLETVTDSGRRPIPFPGCIQALDADGLRRLGQAYLASLPTLAEGKTRLVDKMPVNFVYVGLIRLILPNARIVHTLRDPVDTCLSCFSKLFLSGLSYSYDLAEAGRYYRAYHAMMAHWRSVLPPGAMLDVSYEDVVGDLEQQARRLIDYCGLLWDDRCLSFHETDRPVATASNAQVRRPLYRSSVARWRRYEAYLEPLLAELEGCRPPQ